MVVVCAEMVLDRGGLRWYSGEAVDNHKALPCPRGRVGRMFAVGGDLKGMAGIVFLITT